VGGFEVSGMLFAVLPQFLPIDLPASSPVSFSFAPNEPGFGDKEIADVAAAIRDVKLDTGDLHVLIDVEILNPNFHWLLLFCDLRR